MSLRAGTEDLRRMLVDLSSRMPSNAAQTIEVYDAVMRAATDAVKQWRYDPPFKAPISFPVTFRFGSEPPPVEMAFQRQADGAHLDRGRRQGRGRRHRGARESQRRQAGVPADCAGRGCPGNCHDGDPHRARRNRRHSDRHALDSAARRRGARCGQAMAVHADAAERATRRGDDDRHDQFLARPVRERGAGERRGRSRGPRAVLGSRALERSKAGFVPYWSPDGTKLAFLSNRDGKPDVRHEPRRQRSPQADNRPDQK